MNNYHDFYYPQNSVLHAKVLSKNHLFADDVDGFGKIKNIFAFNENIMIN